MDESESFILQSIWFSNPFLELIYNIIVVGQSIFLLQNINILISNMVALIYLMMHLNRFRYCAHDEVGGCTIVMYFHTAMVKNEKQ